MISEKRSKSVAGRPGRTFLEFVMDCRLYSNGSDLPTVRGTETELHEL
jgi:hypothetical protein